MSKCNLPYQQNGGKKHKIISLDTEKVFCKIQCLLLIKVLERLRTQRTYLNIIRKIYGKPMGNIKSNGEKLKAIPLKLGTKQERPLFPYLWNREFKVLTRATRLVERTKRIPLERKKSKYHYLKMIMIVCVTDLKNSTSELL